MMLAEIKPITTRTRMEGGVCHVSNITPNHWPYWRITYQEEHQDKQGNTKYTRDYIYCHYPNFDAAAKGATAFVRDWAKRGFKFTIISVNINKQGVSSICKIDPYKE